jgi:hypothetical protein
METRKRPDRALKLILNKGTSETVIKASLKRLLVGQDKQLYCQAIEKRVQECSKRTRRASVLLNLLIRKLFHDKENVSDVQIPEFWDQTFIRQLMLGIEDAQKPFHEIVQLFEEYPDLIPKFGRSSGDRNIYSFAAIKLSTNIKNHLVLNFPKVLKRYLYHVLPENDVFEAFFKVHGWSRRGDDNLQNQMVIQGHVLTIRGILGLLEDDVINETWLKDHKEQILKFFVFVNRYFDQENKTLFNVLPFCRMKAHFITIDTFTMKGILKELGYLGKEASSLDSDLWNSFIKTSPFQGKNKTFTGTIDTDGLVVNVHFRRPKNITTESKAKEISLEGKRAIGVDPGRVNIFSTAEEVEPNKFIHHTLTRAQYYNDSGINKANTQSARWNLKVKRQLIELSDASPKSVKMEKFSKFLETLGHVENDLWSEYLKMRWRTQRFRLHGGKKRVFANFFNKLDINGDTILCFGAAKFAPGGKGEVSVPTTRAFKECTYRTKTVPIDEFRTSKLYWKDESLLQKVVKRNIEGKKIDVRGLLWCNSTKEINKFVNRDHNAAINILRLGRSSIRPLNFDRKRTTERLPEQGIGRILKY